MPILAAEPCVFPTDLLTGPSSGTAAEWRVLHTKPRQEKSLARELLAREIGYYLPTTRKANRSSGRIRMSGVPFFDGYMFLFADREQYLAALSTKRVVRSLSVSNPDILRRDLRRLQITLDSEMAVEREPSLLPGQLVEITEGLLVGLRGTIIRSTKGQRFVVSVNFIGQGASFTCDAMSFRPVTACD